MRLLHIKTLQLQEFYSDPPPYVITSHRWQDEEATFQEFSQGINRHKKGHQKIQNFCNAVAGLVAESPQLEIKLEWLWIDTCCIDKTNSVELQEALNSMFRWYAEAVLCLAFLHDVPSLDETPDDIYGSMRNSIYWTRGWMLQELLAPKLVLFYNQSWEVVGRKNSPKRVRPLFSARAIGIRVINDWVIRWTGIPREVIHDFSEAEKLSIDEKRSWIADRKTTRIEDRVYCQLGIFGVFMPLIYGEGDNAMVRLEEAIEQKQRRAERQQRVRVRDVKPDSPSVEMITFTVDNFNGYKLMATEHFVLPENKTVADLTDLVSQKWPNIPYPALSIIGTGSTLRRDTRLTSVPRRLACTPIRLGRTA